MLSEPKKLLYTMKCGCVWIYRLSFGELTKTILKPCSEHLDSVSPIAVYHLPVKEWEEAISKLEEPKRLPHFTYIDEAEARKLWQSAEGMINDPIKKDTTNEQN